MKFIRFFLTAVLFMVLFLAGPSHAGTTAAKPRVQIDASKIIRDTNFNILGNNIQWVDDADGLFDHKTGTFNPALIEKIKKLKITSLRFPGGSFSDVYHWKDGVGPQSKRKKGTHIFLGTKQESYFGTDEFLQLCRLLNAEPVITVNTLTGTPEEAAEWVRYCAGRVRYWEIGNEPYLEPTNDKKKIDPAYPDKFAEKFIQFAKAMKDTDGKIKVGIPLRNNLAGRYPGGPHKEWNTRMKDALKSADYVCLHNAYFPMIFKREDYKDPASFIALMAADKQVRDDLDETKNFLKKNAPDRKYPIAITEYNAFFAAPGIPESSATASLAGGLYVASLLTDFFKDESLSMAHFWSLTGNWFFGALTQNHTPRPQYFALQLFSDYVGDKIIFSSITGSRTFQSEAAGYMPAKQNIASLKILASVKDNLLFIILVNKSAEDMRCALDIQGFGKWINLKGALLTGPSFSSNNETREEVTLKGIDAGAFGDFSDVRIPAHSVLALRLKK